jgi:hypothetical protein
MRALLLAATALSLATAAPGFAQNSGNSAIAALAPVPEGRLSDAITPGAYRLDLTVDPDQERFSGAVEIDATLKAASPFVDLHGRDLAMRSATAVAGGKTYPGTWTELDPTGVGRLTFAEPLPAGPVTFKFAYDAPFQSGPAGSGSAKVSRPTPVGSSSVQVPG